MNRKVFYTFMVILITAVSMTAMLYNYRNGYGEFSISEQQPVNIINYEDREYLGYIFDDYNRHVNLSYVDKVYKASTDIKNGGEDESLNVMNNENSIDNIRDLRSEKAIEEKEVKGDQ